MSNKMKLRWAVVEEFIYARGDSPAQFFEYHCDAKSYLADWADKRNATLEEKGTLCEAGDYRSYIVKSNQVKGKRS